MKKILFVIPLCFLLVAHAAAQSQQPSGAEKYFSDVELIDQNGQKVRFYNDVLKGKTVVITRSSRRVPTYVHQ